MSTTTTTTQQTVLPDVSSVERHGYLFGFPIAHSMSPLFHNTVYADLGLNWNQFYLESTDMEVFLKARQDPKFYGASVTMPHKMAILPHLDEITEEGREVGAVNTLFLKEDHTTGKRIFCGTNTDVVGVRDAFVHNVKDPAASYENRPAMVVGGGGAARSAVYALRKWMKASKIYLVNRDRNEVKAVIDECTARGFGESLIDVSTAAQAEQLEGVGAVVACVPDFPPKTSEEKEARAVLETFLDKPHKGAILEMCYHPSPWTEIAGISEKAGWQLILGTEAMIYQGLEQDRYWTGKPVSELPKAKVQAVIAAKLAEARH